MSFSPLINELINSLRCLPGVGAKTAQRMAFHLLVRDRIGALKLAENLTLACQQIKHCSICRNLTEAEQCEICTSSSRKDSLLCIVENPADVVIIDNATAFRGKYFVLLGRLSPLDGIGPNELGLELLAKKLDSDVVQEIIIATNPTVEGEATAHYISEMAHRRKIKVSRIAHGIPLGGELEFIDNSTLSQAFNDRREISE